MAETAVGEMVELDFDDQLRREGFPFAAALCAPAAWAAGGFAGEAAAFFGWLFDFFDFGREILALFDGQSRAEADVIEKAVVVVETQEKRAKRFGGFGAVAEAGHDAVGCSQAFDLDHSVAQAGAVIAIKLFGDDAVQRRASAGEPFVDLPHVVGDG